MDKILDVMEDIKQNITDNQHKIIMDSLMKIHKIEENNIKNESTSHKCTALLNWLDTKLELTDDSSDVIKRNDLYKYIISNYYNDQNFKNIYFMKQVLKMFFMHEPNYQYDKQYFRYVSYRR